MQQVSNRQATELGWEQNKTEVVEPPTCRNAAFSSARVADGGTPMSAYRSPQSAEALEGGPEARLKALAALAAAAAAPAQTAAQGQPGEALPS